MFTASASPSASNARACPAWIFWSVRSCWVSRGSCNRRIVFAMCDRDTPTRSARSSCFRPRSSSSWRKASASSIGPRSCRWMFSMSASRRRSASSVSRSTTGTVASPATFAARKRRSPARARRHPRQTGERRSVGGCQPPGSRLPKPGSRRRPSASAAASDWGVTEFTGTSSSPVASYPASGAPGINAESPRPRPPRSTSFASLPEQPPSPLM